MVSAAGGIDIEEVAADDAGEDPLPARRPALRPAAVRGACAWASSCTRTSSRRAPAAEDHAAALRRVHGRAAARSPRSTRWSSRRRASSSRVDGKMVIDDNELDRLPAIAALRDESVGGAERGGRAQREPHLHQARRRRRLRGERRRPRDGHDGPGQVLRRRAGELPRHRRLVEPGEGRQRAAHHHRRPEREGDPVQHLRRHHAHRRRGERHRDGHQGRTRSRCRS